MKRTEPAENEKTYRLLPSLMTATLGEEAYFYDGMARITPLVSIPTRKVPWRAYSVVKRLKAANPAHLPWSLEKIKGLFRDPKDVSAVDVLLRRGYLEEFQPDSAVSESENVQNSERSSQTSESLQETYAALLTEFEKTEAKHFFNAPRLFNVPEELPDKHVDVGFVGVPFSTVAESAGTIHSPLHFRTLSQQCGCWFDIYQKGGFSEIGMNDTLPSLLSQGVMLKDYGDLGSGTRTVEELFVEIRHFIDDTVIPTQIRPLFAGGDHAITFPIVDAFLKHYPDMCLIHLDAHSDLFYSSQILFNHAAPLSNLLLYSDLSSIYSFGLRKEYKHHMGNFVQFRQDRRITERLHLFSIGTFKQLISNRHSFEKILSRIDSRTPCYLSIDLDVLSANEIANQVSTPCGVGLDWWELYEALSILFSCLNIVGCDVVEFNLTKKNQPDDPQKLPSLLLLLIDRLARYSSKGSH